MCRLGICSFCRLRQYMSHKSLELIALMEAELRRKDNEPSPEERLERYLELKRRGML